MIDMLSKSAVTAAIETLLTNATSIGGESVGIGRSEEAPMDPPPNGWVGVYGVGMQFPERVLGAGNAGRSHRIDIMLMCVQTAETGSDCEDRLGELVKDVLDVILEDGSFGGNVNSFDSVEVRYPDYQRSDATVYRQTAFIFITGLKSI